MPFEMALECFQGGRVHVRILLLIIWWMHMDQGHGQGRCPLRLFYSRSTIYAVEGGVFSLSCKATYCEKSPLKPELIWCKQTSNGCSFLPQLVEFANRTKAILHFGSGTLISVLQISPVHINHTGIYQCRGKFPSLNPIIAMGHFITVLVIKFKMFTPVSIMSGLRGDSLKLRCIVEFDEHLNTTLTVHWTKDNGYCNESLSRHKTSNQTMATDKRSFTLTLSNLQREDAGVYYCCAASQLSAQIIGMGLINVHVHSVNYNQIYFALVLIWKVVALVIIIAVGLTLICKEKSHQQKDDDASQRSVGKQTKNNVVV